MPCFLNFLKTHTRTGAEDQSKTGRLNFEQFMVWYASNGQGLSGKTWTLGGSLTITIGGGFEYFFMFTPLWGRFPF